MNASIQTLVVLCFLQPTSPFRKLATINAAIDAFQIDSRHSIVSVTKVECHPSRMFSIIDNYLVSENLDADFNSPSQALDPISLKWTSIFD